MNEINISIPYSLFKEMFYCFVDLHFKAWAIKNRDAKQDYNSPRPLVDVLPVVDLKPYKGDKKC